jgi:gliding motility associated protien GldN
MKNTLFSLIVLFSVCNLHSQLELINGGPVNVPSEGVIDGIYIKEHVPTKRMIAYEDVREADVIWNRRVWSYIDLREKINHSMYYPFDDYTFPDGVWIKNNTRWSLWTVIKHNIYESNLTIYEPKNPLSGDQGPFDGDQFKYPLKSQNNLNYASDKAFKDKVDGYLNIISNKRFVAIPSEIDGSDSVTIDPATQLSTVVTKDTFDLIRIKSENIVQYRLKEEWFFDKERSVLDKRILGLAPVIYDQTKEGGKYVELFWLYFPECRLVFNNYFVYNELNDAQWMSFDDLFWKRRFNAVMYKESNVYDRGIDTYKNGVDALHEAERIKEGIRTIEHDVWNF